MDQHLQCYLDYLHQVNILNHLKEQAYKYTMILVRIKLKVPILTQADMR